ncbi:MAG: sensor histidine kinase [Spirochaetaceae bacterium]|nr:MAG: sensor histidine kinase [Spirochaetaceae bacterium]
MRAIHDRAEISVDHVRMSLRLFAVLGYAVAGLIIFSADSGVQMPTSFTAELVVIGIVGLALVGISFFPCRIVGYIAFGWLVLVMCVVRIAMGAGFPVLVLLLSALALAPAVPSVSGRRVASLAAVGLATFLPTPGLVFGAPSPVVDVGTTAGILLIALTVFCALELITHVLESMGEERQQNRRLESGIQSLTKVNVGFQKYSQTVEERSKHEERNRITRDIHDTVGYSLTNIAVMLDAAIGLIERDPERVKTMLQRGREQVDSSHTEVRRSLHALRAIAQVEKFGARNLLHIGRQFEEATSVIVDIDLGNAAQTYGPHVDSTLSRLVQEGLANAFRHGRATEVSVRLWESDDRLTLTIRDNGSGSEEIELGIGFLGMQERLSQIHGSLSWQSLATGFVLIAEVVLSGNAGPGRTM